jgi:uncharacterized protein YecE (DUF72 family)
MYRSNYSRAQLRELANSIQGLKAAAWIIFDNTAGGRAISNALQLQALAACDGAHPLFNGPSRKAQTRQRSGRAKPALLQKGLRN